MKTKLFILLAVLAANSAHAQIPTTFTNEVAAQANITRDSISNLISKVGTNSTSGYQASDYLAQLPSFRSDTSAAMNLFQNDLESNILKKVNFWVNRYNTIYQSNDYSAEQKRELLDQQRAIMQGQMTLIQSEYQEAIKKLYRLLGNIPTGFDTRGKQVVNNRVGEKATAYCSVHIKVGFVEADQEFDFTSGASVTLDHYADSPDVLLFSEISTLSERYGDIKDSLRPAVSDPIAFLEIFMPDLLPKIYRENVYPLFSKGCQSQICLGLKASDYSSLLSMISQSLDRDLVIRLADQNYIRLSSLHYNTKLAQSLLANVNYPTEGKALPFDTK